MNHHRKRTCPIFGTEERRREKKGRARVGGRVHGRRREQVLLFCSTNFFFFLLRTNLQQILVPWYGKPFLSLTKVNLLSTSNYLLRMDDESSGLLLVVLLCK